MSPTMKDLTTSEAIQKELSNLEQSLVANKRRQERLSKGGSNATKNDESRPLRLMKLELHVECMALQQDLSIWGKSFVSMNSGDDLVNDITQCLGLGQLLCRHPPNLSHPSDYGDLYTAVFQREYQPLRHYTRSRVIGLLRKALQAEGYPSEEGCQALLYQFQAYQEHPTNDEKTVAWCCDFLTRLQVQHLQVAAHLNPNSAQNNRSDVVVELCRPLLERMRFHFVQVAPDRITSSRLDRLPEWLCNYVREHVFEGGPWELVVDGVASILEGGPNMENTAMQFLSEVVHLTQSLLTERSFFRHDAVAGPDSSPRILCNAIEQLLTFDSYVRELVPESVLQCPGLTDMNVGADDELWNWWLGRENEYILSALFQATMGQTRTTLLSPRSEIFCALMQSAVSKSRVLSPPLASAYIARVAVPACMEFLDAIHTSSKDLKSLLCQRGADLESNTTCWMEIINGTHLASLVLVSTSWAERQESREDLARVGRSMERLRDVLVEEFATTFVEIVLMERAKLASYLMRCPHLLSTSNVVLEDPSLSEELHDVIAMLSKVVTCCNTHLQAISSSDIESYRISEKHPDALIFAPNAVMDSLANMVPDKFLEVALDAHGMTPDIVLGGATQFRRDALLVVKIFESEKKVSCRRLLDVTKFMSMTCEWLHSLREALLGLVQFQVGSADNPGILLYQHFSSDSTLFEEAKSMIDAKGFTNLELEDALSILNRRKDSFL